MMGRVLYFIPSVQAASEGILEELGISSALRDSPHASRSAARGPGGTGGCVVVPTGTTNNERSFGYFPKRQEWKQATNGKYWLGKYTDNPPTPESMRRPEMITGHKVELQDGNEWEIPVARVFPTGSGLPQSIILGPNGELVAEALPQYAKLSKMAERVWDQFLAEVKDHSEPGVLAGAPDFTVKEQWEIATEALAMNYIIGQEEVSFLRLFTTHNIGKVWGALIDMPTMIAVNKELEEAAADPAKKKDAAIQDGDSSNDGEQVDSTLTTQPSQTLTGSTDPRNE